MPRLVYSAYITLPTEDHQNLLVSATLRLDNQKLRAITHASPLLFSTNMSALMRRITIQGLRFVKITDPIQKTRIMEQPYNERLLQGVQPDLNLELITTPGLPYPSGWPLKEDFETVVFSKSSDGETKIIAPKCTFSRPLPEEIKGVPLMFEAEVKALFPVSGGYSDKLTSKHWVTTKGANEWETIRLPFTVQDGESSQLYALRFTIPTGEEQTVTIRKLKIVLGDPTPSLTSVAASSN